MNMRTRNYWLCGLLLAVVCLAGCTVGPDFEPPQPDVPGSWSEVREQAPDAVGSRINTRLADIEQWWQVFDDPTLTLLVSQALKNNLNLKQAAQRIVQARAQLAIVSGRELPDVGAGLSYSHRRISDNGLASAAQSSRAPVAPTPPIPGGGLGEVDLFQAGFDASWELDLFGRNRRRTEAARARLAASVESRRGVRVALAAEVARNYFALRGNQYRLQVAREAVASQRETLELIQDRQQAGLASRVAVQRAAGRLATTRSNIPPLETGVRQAMHRLSVLLGKAPGALDARLSEPAALPDVPEQVPVGLPSTLVRRRPDIRRAERLLHAATADIGVAVSRLFPQFSISGNFGFQSTEFDLLDSWGSRFFGIGPSLTIPIFQGGRLRAMIRIEKAQRKQALLAYRQTVLTALREVEDAIVAYRNVQRRRHALAESVAANQDALDMARELYRSGLTGYLAVIDAQQAVLQSRDALAQSVQATRTQLVALYKALGGGWPMPETT